MRWAVAIAVMVAGAGSARADAGVEVQLRVIAPTGDDAPQIRATVIGRDPPPAHEITLTETDVSPPITLGATSIVPYREGGEPIAIAVVIEAHTLWMTMPMYEELGASLDAIGHAGPPGSLGELISYGRGASVRVPFGPLRRIDRIALGLLGSYDGVVTRDLVDGVQHAADDLRAVAAPRKVLIVIGDGADTNPDAALAAMPKLRQQLLDENIDAYAIYYEADSFDGDLSLIKRLTPAVQTASSMVSIPAMTGAIVDRLARRFDAIFPGYDGARDVGFAWDGKPHHFALAVARVPVGDLDLELGAGTAPSHARRWPWLLLGAGGLMLALAIAAARRHGRVVTARWT